MTDLRRIFDEHRPNPGYCLLIRPMHDASYDEFWDKVAIAFHRTFAWKDVGRLAESGDIMDTVLREMAESDVIVADVSQERANVFYELGIAHAKKGPKKVVLVTGVQPAEAAPCNLPFDVQGMRVVPYKPKTGMDDFLRRLQQALFASLEGTTWFHLATNKAHTSELTPGDGGNYIFEVKALAITGEARLQNEGVDIELTVRRQPLPERGIEASEESAPVTLLLGDPDKRTHKIPHLPWRLRSEGHDTSRGELEAVICMVPDRT
jgi:hypothetical protein